MKKTLFYSSRVQVLLGESEAVAYFVHREEAMALVGSKKAAVQSYHQRGGRLGRRVISIRVLNPACLFKQTIAPLTTCPDSVATAVAGSISRGHAKRARLLESVIGSHTKSEWMDVISRYGNKCLRCEASGDSVSLTKDHVTPLADGGTNYASNLQPPCGPCNTWKSNREIDFRGPLAFAAPVSSGCLAVVQ